MPIESLFHRVIPFFVDDGLVHQYSSLILAAALQAVCLILRPLHILLILQMFQNILDPVDVCGCIYGRFLQYGQHELLHGAVLTQFFPQRLRKSGKFQFISDPVAQLSVYNRIINKIEVIADIVT